MPMPGLTGALIAVGAVIAFALLLRSAGGKDKSEGSVPVRPDVKLGPESEPEAEPIDEDGDGVDDRLVIAVTSDGRALLPDRHLVLELPPEESGEEWKVGARLERSTRFAYAAAKRWRPGDLRGIRVIRGDFDDGPWLLEALGRDGEYLAFTFEAREAAQAAKELFERIGIVRLGEDEAGRPMPPSAEQFAEARRILDETAAELDLPDELHDPADDRDDRDEGRP